MKVLVLLSLFAGFAANAEVIEKYSCKSKADEPSPFEAIVTIHRLSSDAPVEKVFAVLKVNGELIPAMHEECVWHNYKGYFCNGQKDEVRYDIYPRFKYRKGNFVETGVIVTIGDDMKSYRLKDCSAI